MALTEERRRELESLLGSPPQARQQSQNASVADQLESALGIKPPESPGFGKRFLGELKAAPGKMLGIAGETVKQAGRGIKEIGFGTAEAFAGAGETAQKAVDDLLQAAAQPGLTPSQRITKGVSGIVGAGEATLGAVLAPAAGTLKAVPPLEKAVTFGMEKLNEVALESSKRFQQKLGLSLLPEEQEVMDRSFSLFLNALGLKFGEKAAGTVAEKVSLPIEGAIKAGVEKTADFISEKGIAIAKGIGEVAEIPGKIKEKLTPDILKGEAPEQAARIVQSTQKIDPTKEIAFEKMSKKKVGNWLVERDIIAPREETVGILTDRWVKAKNALDEGVAKIPGQYSHPVVEKILNELIDFYKNTANREGLSLSRRRLKTLQDEGLTMSEVLNIKRDYERNVKVNYLKENNAMAVERATNLDSDIREFFAETAEQKGFGNIRDLSKEIQQSRFLAEEIYRKLQKQRPNNLFGLTDNLLLVGGAINPKALVALGLKKILSSETFKSFAARKLGAPKVAKPIPEVPTKRIELKAKQEAFRNKPPSPKGKGAIPQTIKLEAEEFSKLVERAQTVDKSLTHHSIEELSTLNTKVLSNKHGGYAYRVSGRDVELSNVFVIPEARGKGLGSQIMNTAINEAKALGLKKIKLDAYKYLEPFYEKFGFKTVKEVDFDPKLTGFDPRIKGQEWKHNVIFMEKEL